MKKITFYSLAIIGLSFVFMAASKKNTPLVSLQNIEKSFVKVDSNLYASIYETTNFQYQEFLKDLQEKKDLKTLEIAKLDTANWKSEELYMEPFTDYYHKHPAYGNYPVVNISQKGAQQYCAWLTEKYNNMPMRKFKKVLFRLPNLEEWQKAARGNLKITPYPWGEPEVTGHCNFHEIDQSCIHWIKEENKYTLPKSEHHEGVANKMNDKDVNTMAVNAFKANSIGLFSRP